MGRVTSNYSMITKSLLEFSKQKTWPSAQAEMDALTLVTSLPQSTIHICYAYDENKIETAIKCSVLVVVHSKNIFACYLFTRLNRVFVKCAGREVGF